MACLCAVLIGAPLCALASANEGSQAESAGKQTGAGSGVMPAAIALLEAACESTTRQSPSTVSSPGARSDAASSPRMRPSNSAWADVGQSGKNRAPCQTGAFPLSRTAPQPPQPPPKEPSKRSSKQLIMRNDVMPRSRCRRRATTRLSTAAVVHRNLARGPVKLHSHERRGGANP